MTDLQQNRVYNIGEIDTLRTECTNLLDVGIFTCTSWDMTIGKIRDLFAQCPNKASELGNALNAITGSFLKPEYEDTKNLVSTALSGVTSQIPQVDYAGAEVIQDILENTVMIPEMIHDFMECLKPTVLGLSLSEFQKRLDDVKEQWDGISIEENLEYIQTQMLGVTGNTAFTGYPKNAYEAQAGWQYLVQRERYKENVEHTAERVARENGIKALNDYLTRNSELTEEERNKILGNIAEQNPEALGSLALVIERGGLEAGNKVMEKLIVEYTKNDRNILEEAYFELSAAEKRFVDNIQKLDYTDIQKDMLRIVAITFFREGYDPEFVVGVMANCYHEGCAGELEDTNGSAYEYWVFMNENFEFNKKYSKKNIGEIGIDEYAALLEACENVPQQEIEKAKFGLGMFQWTEHSRAMDLLECYREICGNDNFPTYEQCYQAELLMTLRELDGTYQDGYYKKKVTDQWMGITGSEGAKEACTLFCRYYEGQSKEEQEKRVPTAEKIYRIVVEE